MKGTYRTSPKVKTFQRGLIPLSGTYFPKCIYKVHIYKVHIHVSQPQSGLDEVYTLVWEVSPR